MDEGPDTAPLGLQDGANCLLYRTTAEAVDSGAVGAGASAEAEAIAQAGQSWAAPGRGTRACG